LNETPLVLRCVKEAISLLGSESGVVSVLGQRLSRYRRDRSICAALRRWPSLAKRGRNPRGSRWL